MNFTVRGKTKADKIKEVINELNGQLFDLEKKARWIRKGVKFLKEMEAKL